MNNLRDKAYKAAKEKGFYNGNLSDKHYLCLVVTELCEAVQADRSGKRANMRAFELNQEVHPDSIGWFAKDYELTISGTVEDELADAVIRLLSFAGYKGAHVFNPKTKYLKSRFEDCSFIESVFYIISRLSKESYIYYLDLC
ncbi:MAG: hypothetical protein ACRCZY_07890, partial [Phocaeicola sp.]